MSAPCDGILPDGGVRICGRQFSAAELDARIETMSDDDLHASLCSLERAEEAADGVDADVISHLCDLVEGEIASRCVARATTP